MDKVKRTRRTKKQMEEARAASAPKRKPKYLSKERRSFEVSPEEFRRLRGLG